LVDLPYGGCSAENLPHKLAKVESRLGGVFCRVLLCLSNGLGDACLV
jgi:hypothetical protein